MSCSPASSSSIDEANLAMRDEEAGDRGEMADRLAAAQPFFEPVQVGVVDRCVALDGEQRRHVDVDAVRGRAARGLDARGRGGDLDHGVGALDARPQLAGGRDGAVGVVGERRRDLEADEAVGASGARVDGREHVGGRLDVLDGQRVVDLELRAAGERGDPARVAIGPEHGRAEDRRVGRQPGHGVLVHEALELGGRHEAVDPDARAKRGQAAKRRHRSRLLPPAPKSSLASATRCASAASALRPQARGS
jgi:hypothetical protein